MIFGVGLVLLGLEIFVIPGFGIAGISGIALMMVAVLLSLLALDFRVSWNLGLVNHALVVLSTSIIITIVGAFLLVRLLPSSRATRRLVLGQSLTVEEGFVSHDRTDQDEIPLGSMGEAITDLRPAGKIRVQGKKLDAVSEGDYIASGTKVKIVQWRTGTAVVRDEPEAPGRAEETA